MESFIKDANFKDSKLSLFTQIADLVAYAAFLKARQRFDCLTKWQAELNLGDAYEHIPPVVLNRHAHKHDPHGIVWLEPG